MADVERKGYAETGGVGGGKGGRGRELIVARRTVSGGRVSWHWGTRRVVHIRTRPDSRAPRLTV